MFQLNIANLQVKDSTFEIPGAIGVWEFKRFGNYDSAIRNIEDGLCAHTHIATNKNVDFSTCEADLVAVCGEITDICLVLSFLNARCVAPTGTTAWSQPQIMGLGDQYIKPRAILGFEQLTTMSLTSLFCNWTIKDYDQYKQRKLRLQLTHWLSGLTCFSLEDLYLSAGVQMDLIKQIETFGSTSPRLTYFNGMLSASGRYGIEPLDNNFKNMRNDIVHEGCLSGTNFPNRSKLDCANVIASTLNWIDAYILKVLGMAGKVAKTPRWVGDERPRWVGDQLNAGLPAFSIP